jgi:hypothetical protein
MDDLTAEASQGHNPLLHIECHGDAQEGLEFSNGSTLEWQALHGKLVELNQTMGLNLVVSIAACYGGYLADRRGSFDKCGWFGLVAPTEEVGPHELLQGFREFYRIFFQELDAGIALRGLKKLKLSEGEWMSELAEAYFQNVTYGFVVQHCSPAALKRKVAEQLKRLRGEGAFISSAQVKVKQVELYRKFLLGENFNNYFMVAQHPQNAQRFAPTKLRIMKALEELRALHGYSI